MSQYTRFQVEDHVQRLAVVGDLFIEPSQIEFVLDVIFINLKAGKIHRLG